MDEFTLTAATDPSTSADVLREFFLAAQIQLANRFHRNPEEIKSLALALVRNPSTPFDVLLLLVRRTPALLQVLPENPVFSLLLLSHPELYQSLTFREWLALASSRETPAALLAEGVERILTAREGAEPLLLRALLTHPSMPPEVLARAAAHRLERVRACAVANPALPREPLALLVRLGSSEDLQSYLAPAPDVSEEEIFEACSLGDWGTRLAAAHPGAPSALLERLARHHVPEVVLAVAANPATPSASLLALSKQYRAVEALAGNPSSPPEVLARLAWNPACGEPLLGNPSLPPAALVVLCGSLDAAIRARAAAHPRLSAEWKALLSRVGFDAALSSIPAAPTDPDDLLKLLEGGTWFQEMVLQWMPLSAPAQIALVRSRHTALKRMLASEPSLTPEAISILALGNDVLTLRALLQREDRSERLLEDLLRRDLSRSTLEQLVADSRTPTAILEKLVGRVSSVNLLRNSTAPTLSLLQEINHRGDVSAILEFAGSPKISEEHLEFLAMHEDRLVRRAIALNPRTPSTWVLLLRDDPHESVRNAARQRVVSAEEKTEASR